MNIIAGISPTANQRLRELLKIFPEINKVILFGSRALNTQKEGSDIDLALFGNNISFETLRNLRLKYYNLNLPYKLELLHYEAIDNLMLKQHIDSYGKLFYEAENKTPV